MSGPVVLVLRILLAIALYAFLCLCLWMLWQDLRRAGFEAMQPKIPPIQLEIRQQHAEPVFRAFSIPQIMIGRDPACEIRIEDEAVSARHARLSYHHAQWWLEDLQSTNGTTLNQLRLTTATVLTDGDEIRCGMATVLVHLSGDAVVMPKTMKLGEQHDG